MKNYLKISSLIRGSKDQSLARKLALGHNIPLVSSYLAGMVPGDAIAISQLAEELSWGIVCAKKAQERKVMINQYVNGQNPGAEIVRYFGIEESCEYVRKAEKEQVKQALTGLFVDAILSEFSLTWAPIYLCYGEYSKTGEGLCATFATPIHVWSQESKKTGARAEVVRKIKKQMIDPRKNPPVCAVVRNPEWLAQYAENFQGTKILNHKDIDAQLHDPNGLCRIFEAR
jgi:hypothetical protein